MFTYLPLLYEGEIIDVVESPTEEFSYTCLVSLSGGQQILLPYVRPATMFGGIANYFQMRSRASKDFKPVVFDGSDPTVRVGDRVYISFLSGSIKKPIIVGYAQHPNKINEYGSENLTGEPSFVFQFNGMRATVDGTGQFTLIHKGAPKIVEPDLQQATLQAVEGLLGLGGSSNPALGPSNSPAVTPADETGITLLEFLDNGLFRIRDSDGQMFELDRVKGRIYISNNDLKSTEDPEAGPASGGNLLAQNATDAEYVLLEKKRKLVLINARGIAQIYTEDLRKDVTEGNHSHKVGGDSTWLIGGDENITISGSKTDQIAGSWSMSVVGDAKLDSKGSATFSTISDAIFDTIGSFKVSSKSGVNLSAAAGGALDLSTGVKLGNLAGDLLKQVSDGLDKASMVAVQAAAIIVPTAVGPSGPPTNAQEFAKLAGELAALKLVVDAIMG